MDNSVGTVLMDSSIGTIIYIILMILVFAGSAMKNKKRKKPVSKPNPQGNPDNSTLGGKLTDFINKLMEEAIPETKPPVSQFPDDIFPEDSELVEEFTDINDAESKGFTDMDDAETENFIPEGVSVFSSDDPSTPFIETGIENELSTTSHQISEEIKQGDLTRSNASELDTVISDFSFKKAIIFSEILKPKYFKIHDY